MQDQKYYVFIMARAAGQLYVGATTTFQSVLRSKGTDRLVYYETFRYALSAVALESQIQALDQMGRVALIQSTNPAWADLADAWSQATFADGESPRSLEEEEVEPAVLV